MDDPLRCDQPQPDQATMPFSGALPRALDVASLHWRACCFGASVHTAHHRHPWRHGCSTSSRHQVHCSSLHFCICCGRDRDSWPLPSGCVTTRNEHGHAVPCCTKQDKGDKCAQCRDPFRRLRRSSAGRLDLFSLPWRPCKCITSQSTTVHVICPAAM